MSHTTRLIFTSGLSAFVLWVPGAACLPLNPHGRTSRPWHPRGGHGVVGVVREARGTIVAGMASFCIGTVGAGLFFLSEVCLALPPGFLEDNILAPLELGLMFLAYACIFAWSIVLLVILARTLVNWAGNRMRTKTDEETRKRRWYQFSLWTLLLAVLLVSLAMSWVAVRMERRREAAEALHARQKSLRVRLALFKSKSRCCLCLGLNNDDQVKEGQIAHIDGNPSNSMEDNLVFLCMKHHSLLDTKTSQHKGLTHAQVKHFRQKLYEHLKDEQKKAREKAELMIQQVKGIVELGNRLRELNQ